jgi:hypothetical protein
MNNKNPTWARIRKIALYSSQGVCRVFMRRGIGPELPFDTSLPKEYYFLQHCIFSTDISTKLETDT